MPGKIRWRFLPFAGLLFVLGLQIYPRFAETQNAPQPDVPKVDFQKDIQPILQKNCYSCHGADAQMSGLRLDSRQAILTGGTNGKILVPGKSAGSSIYKRVAGIGDLSRMPFGGTPLTAAQIQLIRDWIDQGAEIPESAAASYVPSEAARKHWGFIAPVKPPVPAVSHKAWVQNPIDAFILAKLEKEGLPPSPRADRVTLLRRLSLDLIGLPPTDAEVDAFLADKRPNAYEKQVDRLLDSPHYGERWGRMWLDAARYADSNGYEKDQPRSVWFYRDWVINALNRDLPYNQFIIDQIAGDLLPHATQDQIVATGFLRNSMLNEEGGIDPEQFRMEAMFDRMDAIGKGILGLTIQCAQCHNHKYDPLKQEEYYQMFAFLNDRQRREHRGVHSRAADEACGNLPRDATRLRVGLQHEHPSWKTRNGRVGRTGAARPAGVDGGPADGGRHLHRRRRNTCHSKTARFLCSGLCPPTKHTVKMSREDGSAEHHGGSPRTARPTANLPLGGPGRSIKGRPL